MVAWQTKVVALVAAIGAVNAQLGPKPPVSALLSAENAGAEKFGDVVAAQDDAVLATFQADAGEFHVQTYKLNATEGTWEQTGVVGPFSSEITAMAFSGDKVYVGTPGENAVHVLTKANDGESWTKAAVTLTQPYTTNFGLSLAGDSTQLLVGSQFDTFLYTSDETGNLNAVRLTAGLADRRGKVIGQDVALSGEKYLVGAPSESLTSKGVVYVYNGAEDEAPVVLSSRQELSNEFGARVHFYDAAAYVGDTARELVYAFKVSGGEEIISESSAEAFATDGNFVVSVYNGVLTIKDKDSTLEEVSLSSILGDSDVLDIAVDAESQAVVLGFEAESAASIFALQFFYPITAAPVPPTPSPTSPPTKSAREIEDEINLTNFIYGVVGMVGGCLIWAAVVIKRAVDDKKEVNKLKKELEEEAQDRVVIVSGPFSDDKEMDAENGVATKL